MSDTTVFKSVGNTVEDIAAAKLVFDAVSQKQRRRDELATGTNQAKWPTA
jgi:ornithine cyclodeaminase/alanine dehydrogenase-like protein (mu-crystallin family)